MSSLQDILDPQLIRWLVMRAIFCPVNGQVLDVRTCVVFRDADGDPALVVSQSGYAGLSPEQIAKLEQLHRTVDLSTVKGTK